MGGLAFFLVDWNHFPTITIKKGLSKRGVWLKVLKKVAPGLEINLALSQ
jgi:hypothetical protein